MAKFISLENIASRTHSGNGYATYHRIVLCTNVYYALKYITAAQKSSVVSGTRINHSYSIFMVYEAWIYLRPAGFSDHDDDDDDD